MDLLSVKIDKTNSQIKKLSKFKINIIWVLGRISKLYYNNLEYTLIWSIRLNLLILMIRSR